MNRLNTLKKFITFSILVLLLFSMCGCNNSSEKKETKKNKKTVSVEKKQKKEKKVIKVFKIDMGETVSVLKEFPKAKDFVIEDKSVASITENGELQGIKPGKTKFTFLQGKDIISKEVKVRKSGMVYATYRILKGEKLQLQFTDGHISNSWTSADETIVKVNSKGKVVAKKIGTTKLICPENGTQYVCNIEVVKNPEKKIYLTFDDGPNRYSTPKILDILKKNNINATFFSLKPARKDFDLTEREIAEGNTLALHGYQHKFNIVYKSEKVYHNNLDKERALFFKKFGYWCTLSRFPGGSSNTCSSYTPGIMTKLTKKLDDWGYQYVDWNGDSMDAGGAKTSAEVFRNVTRNLHKGTNVVLMHDFYKNDKTINALDDIIKYGKKHGYVFLPMTASTEPIHHTVNN